MKTKAHARSENCVFPPASRDLGICDLVLRICSSVCSNTEALKCYDAESPLCPMWIRSESKGTSRSGDGIFSVVDGSPAPPPRLQVVLPSSQE